MEQLAHISRSLVEDDVRVGVDGDRTSIIGLQDSVRVLFSGKLVARLDRIVEPEQARLLAEALERQSACQGDNRSRTRIRRLSLGQAETSEHGRR